MNLYQSLQSTHPVRRERNKYLPFSLLVYAVLFALFAWLSRILSADNNQMAIFVSALAGAWVALGMTWLWSDGRDDNATLARLIGFGIAGDLVFFGLSARLGSQVLADVCRALGNLGLLLAAIGVGAWVARGLLEKHYLVMACVVAALTDIFSVYAGPTKGIIQTGAFHYLSFAWGIIGAGEVQGIIGSGDFIFLALFFRGVRRFDLDDRKTLFAMNAAIAIGFIATIWSQNGVPALPFFAIALLLVHRKELKRPRA